MSRDLHAAAVSESDLQAHFDDWSRTRKRRAGTPKWLESLRDWTPRPSFRDSSGVRFEPDVLAHDGSCIFVFELKFARKYEPLALPQALHHAQVLATDRKQISENLGSRWPARGAVRPVVVTQGNAWIRHALAYLTKNKLRSGSVRVVEVTALREEDDQECWFWFDEVGNGRWKKVKHIDLPRGARTILGSDRKGWSFWSRAESATYVRVAGNASPDDEASQVWLAQMGTGGGWLTWQWEGKSRDQGQFGMVLDDSAVTLSAEFGRFARDRRVAQFRARARPVATRGLGQ